MTNCTNITFLNKFMGNKTMTIINKMIPHNVIVRRQHDLKKPVLRCV